MRKFAVLGLVSFGLLLLQPSAFAASVHVHIQGFAFSPNDLTVALDDVITWHNHDAAQHTATDQRCPSAGGPGPCAFDSGRLNQGQSFTFVANAGGIFTYECFIHGFTGLVYIDDPLKFADLEVTDLTVVHMNPNPFDPYSSRTVRYTVTNVGDEGAFDSRVTVSYFVKGEERLLATSNLPILQPGDARTFTVRWNDLGLVGDFLLQAVADVDGDVVESDEDNVRQLTESMLLPPGTLEGTDLRDPM